MWHAREGGCAHIVDRALRVLVISPDFPPTPGGIQVLIHRLAAHWVDIRARVVTLPSAEAKAFDSRQAFGITRVRRVPGLGHKGTIGLLNTMAVLEAARYRPHLVLSAHIVTSPAAASIRRLSATPYVQYLYGDEIPERPHLSRFALRRASAAVAVSAHTMALASAYGAPRGRLYCIAPGVDLPGSRREARSPRPTVITISRLADRYKGHDVMIQAMPLIRARVPDVRWVVIGDGPLRPRFEEAVVARGLSDCVRFLGAVSDVERDTWLDRAQVLAMPSRLPATGGGEGFGIVYLEAAAHALPAVAGNVAGATDAVVDRETGVLVDPTDPIAVADAISGLLLDRDRARALGERAAARARTFTWPRVARQVEALIKEVAATR